jgi:EEF1A lysine methyltransferase 4
MDSTDMKDFQDNEFNLIIDKGTLDSILCGEFSIPNGEKMLKEAYRLLGNKGIFVCVSYGERARREHIFVNYI